MKTEHQEGKDAVVVPVDTKAEQQANDVEKNADDKVMDTYDEKEMTTVDVAALWLQRALYVLSTLIVTASVLVICNGIISHYCVLQFNAAALFIILLAALTLLGYVEALHYSNVSVEKWDMSSYQDRFPRACKVQLLVNTNTKVQRFLVGRQFFVIFVVFIISQCTTLPHLPVNYLGLPAGLVKGLLGSGLPGIFLVCTFGQLIPQLFVEQYTLPFLNLYGCWSVTQLAFLAEFVGVCNFSWLTFYAVDHFFFGEEKEAPVTVALNQPGVSAPKAEAQPAEPAAGFMSESKTQQREKIRLGWFDICKYIWSTGVTLGSCLVVGYGISQKYSVMVAPVPLLYIIFIVVLGLLFYLEGLMICIVATQYWNPEDFKGSHPRAYQLHKIVNTPDTVKRFIIGRQFFTICTNFILAQICVFPVWPSDGYNPVLFFILIRSGLVGVMIILCFGQLVPELLAARHPLAFMNMYGSTLVVQGSLLIESIGVGHCAWFVYFATRGLCCGKHMADQSDHEYPPVARKLPQELPFDNLEGNVEMVHEVQIIPTIVNGDEAI